MQKHLPTRQLTVFDSVCIIVGIVIGSGIYETTPLVAKNVTSEFWLFAAWGLGGLISLLGALCYAELATTFPEEGGDYVYLTRAYGRLMGFLFAWSQLWVVRPGSIGAMAYVFARYADSLCPLGSHAFIVGTTHNTGATAGALSSPGTCITSRVEEDLSSRVRTGPLFALSWMITEISRQKNSEAPAKP